MTGTSRRSVRFRIVSPEPGAGVRGCTLSPEVMSRVVWSLYLASLALLPWSWFPPFPWLHERAQWSDVVFAAASLAWAVDRWRSGEWPRLRPVHAAIALYVTWALVSHLAAGLEPVSGRWKLLGLAELAMLMVVTSDMAGRPGGLRRISRVVAGTVVVTAGVSILAVCLFYAGVRTPLVGPYGDLLAGPYPRIRAGTFHPNLLASFCIFASFVVARSDTGLSESFRRVTRIALGLTVVLTFSRAILSYGLARLLHRAVTRTRRRLVAVYAVCALGALAALTVWNLSLDPSRLSSIPRPRAAGWLWRRPSRPCRRTFRSASVQVMPPAPRTAFLSTPTRHPSTSWRPWASPRSWASWPSRRRSGCSVAAPPTQPRGPPWPASGWTH